jgi:hypothetical protein
LAGIAERYWTSVCLAHIPDRIYYINRMQLIITR